MSEKAKKITSLSLYALAFLCCSLAIIMLLIPFTVTFEEAIYAVPPGQYRAEIASDFSYYSRNFFEYINSLKLYDCSTTEETFFVVSLISSLVISVALVVTEVVLLARKITLSSKIFKIILLALSIFSLVPFILAILLQADVGVWKVCDYTPLYLSGYPGWKFYEESTIRGSFVLIPSIILVLVAFFTQCLAGVLNLISKAPKQDESFDSSTFTENEYDDISSENTDNTDPEEFEELIKYKQLLDAGIITQEEFENKKKQILNV